MATAFATGVLDDADAVLVVPGDTPALTPRCSASSSTHCAPAPCALATTTPADPHGYGRDPARRLRGGHAIVEERDATPEQRKVREVNAGVYAFPAQPLRAALDQLTTDNAQGEEYLTDVVAPAGRRAARGRRARRPATLAGVNDREQLAAADAELRGRTLPRLMRDGVTVVDPAATYVDAEVEVGPDAVLLPGTLLDGATRIGGGAMIGPDWRLVDTDVEDGAVVTESVCTGASIGRAPTSGPFAYLRPGTRLGQNTKAGAFVEIKNAAIGEGSKVPHLSYVGDTTIGRTSTSGRAR